MDKLTVSIPDVKSSTYPILLGNGLLDNVELWGLKFSHNQSFVIITDKIVKKIYGNHLAKVLKKQGYTVLLCAINPGELSKNYKNKNYLEKKMLNNFSDKSTIILALGGGVVGDLAGFVAATYMRGISYIQIPTTLLSMVDSSIGGKTGIDTPEGKNTIGAFWQPKAVIIEVSCLKTLSKIELVNGLVEIMKMLLTNDKSGFYCFNKDLNNFKFWSEQNFKKWIKLAIGIKSTIVKNDVTEKNQRMVLNFGHTIGHALEKISNYKIMHGYAVALGILVEAKISELLGLINERSYSDISSALSKIKILGKDLIKYNSEQIIFATKNDKKAKHGIAHYVLLKNIGEVYTVQNSYVFSVPDEIVNRAILQVMSE